MKIIILDDDPTGIQTVHGCKLITQWDKDTVAKALDDDCNFFYVLTNTRAMTPKDAAAVTRSAMEAILSSPKIKNEKLYFISRSDSCLRGHFPLETDVMRQVLTENGVKVWNKTPFIPAFIDAGRVTIDGIHYMKEGERLIPVSETEFAHDNVFAYSTSVLHDYIIEKGANPDDYEIINAQSYEELNVFCDRLTDATKDFDGAVVVRSSSSFPKAFAKVPDQESDLSAVIHQNEETCSSIKNKLGLIIVGSHVKKTTRQLNNLLSQEGVEGIELSVNRILNDANYLKEIIKNLSPTNHQKEGALVLFTSRKEVRLDDANARQNLGQQISNFLVSIVRNLPFTPAYLIAKGGITSHDILTKGLDVKIATVMGQLVKNVPCIMTNRFPYIIFPGNVGDDNSLADAYLKLK